MVPADRSQSSLGGSRKAQVERRTSETEVDVSIDLDGRGQARVETGIGFFDHVLELFAKHGQFDITVTARGDLATGPHHTVCLLYTSDAADDLLCVDLGGRRIIKKKK